MADIFCTEGLPSRPLPIGAFPLPFGFLLLPADPALDDLRDGLLAGRLPACWPPGLEGHRAAFDGDIGTAVEAFSGPNPVSRYNRFVLDPDAVDADEVRAGLGDLGVLVDIVLFALGRSDTVPDAAGYSGEIAALILASHAVLAMGEQDGPAGVAALHQAIAAAAPVSTALAGVLYGALSQADQQVGSTKEAINALQAGIGLLTDTDLKVGCAEQHLELASIYHEMAASRPDLLARAINHYHTTLQTISEESAPEVFAAAHANLAAAYLTMPMIEASDQLRLGVAVGSLRAALGVYKIDTHPREWSSAQLNLANALVYAPSTHQADNLVEAVELYEAVLNSRDRMDDPLGFARVLANQGNALAHLGMFEHARGKLVESRFIFEEFHEYDAVTSVRGLLDEIAKQNVLANSDV